jgi:osmotically-inducible protein OsmY
MKQNTLSASAVALGGLLWLTSPTFAAMPDAWVTTKVKMFLLTTDNVPALDVHVDTIDGKVTLHGNVESDAEKSSAEAAARKVDGVTEVRNLLAVVPAGHATAVDVSDDAIKRRVETVLDRDQALGDSDVEVKSVNDGVVLLSGETKTLTEHRRALEDARSVEGVRNVASEIQSPDKLGDAELWREGEGDKNTDTRFSASDMWITTASKVRLMASSTTPALDINVDTRDGIVTLFGIVPSEEVKQAAKVEVLKTDGVRRVRNELQVVPEQHRKTVEVKDADIKKSIEKQLAEETRLEDADIGMDVKNGVVHLTGEVKSNAERFTALQTARMAPGVRAVVDDMTVATN